MLQISGHTIMRKSVNAYNILSETLKGRDHLVDRDVDGISILNETFQK
jgi:hypothetical protein